MTDVTHIGTNTFAQALGRRVLITGIQVKGAVNTLIGATMGFQGTVLYALPSPANISGHLVSDGLYIVVTSYIGRQLNQGYFVYKNISLPQPISDKVESNSSKLGFLKFDLSTIAMGFSSFYALLGTMNFLEPIGAVINNGVAQLNKENLIGFAMCGLGIAGVGLSFKAVRSSYRGLQRAVTLKP